MILSCPACDSRFSLDDSALGTAGRRVRCGQCRHVWHASPPTIEVEEAHQPPEPADVRVAPPVDDAPIRPPLPSSRAAPAPRRRVGAGLAWALLALVVIAVLGGAVLAKDQILAAWPESERIYSAFGIANPASGAGLELRKVSWKRDTADNNVPLLAIEGEVANASRNIRSVPRIRAAIVGKDGQELKSWVFAPPKLNLIPGESVPFHTELRNPPEGAERLTMIFASGS